MARGLPQAPRWAWAAMVGGLVAVLVLGWLAFNRPSPAPYTPSAEAATTSEDAAGPARVLVVGDSYTGGSGEGGNGPDGWAALVDVDLEGVVIETAAAGGSGYVKRGPSGTTFPELIDAAAGGYDLVVFFGSRNDNATAAEVQAAAAEAFATAQKKSPDAALLVIGPPWVDDAPPAYVTAASGAVNAAAAEAGATWVDPLAEGWFADRPELIGSDGVHPTDDGHRYMADLIRPSIEAALQG